MVPGQRANAWRERIGTDYTVIKAVKLKPANIKEANISSNTNEYLFVKHDDGIVHAYYIALAIVIQFGMFFMRITPAVLMKITR